MKKAKQTLTAALAATLATGALGTVAGASPLDDTYASTLKSVQKAQSEKTQTAINEARVAINAMPKELDWAKGEFSKQVDQVQQPLYTQIIDLIEKGKKEAKQETVNEGRKLLVGVEDAYAKTWSSDFDTIQQTLVNNATEAVKAAVKSQKDEDITKAEKLVEELKTSENADVKKSVEGMEKDLVEKIDIRVKKVEVTNATTVQVTFSKDVDKNTINKDNFVIKNGNLRNYVTDANLVDGKNNIVELTLQSKIDATKEYDLSVSGIKDSKGGNLKNSTTKFKYDKKEVASVEFTSKKAVRNGNVRDMLLIKDEAGRNITKEAKVTFECTSDKSILTKDGKIASSAKIGKEVNIRVYSDDKILAEQTVTIVENLAQTIVGFTVSKFEVPDENKFADITANNKIKVGTTGRLTVFYKDALGNEKKLQGSDLKKIESLNKDVVSISAGKLVANKEGVANIRIQYGDIDQEIEVEVVKTSVEVANLSMKDTSISVAKSDVEKAVRYTLEDTAIGDGVTPSFAEVKVWNETRSAWETKTGVSISKTLKDKMVVINGKDLKVGDIAAKLVVTYQNVKYEQEFTIHVSDPEKFDSYELVAENRQDTIGKPLTNLDQVDGDVVYLKVYALDTNGNRIKDTITNNSRKELYVDGDLESKEFKQGMPIDSLKLEKGDHSYFVRVYRNNVEFNTDHITITTENTDDKDRNVDVKEQVTTGSALMSLFNWVYDDVQNTDSDTDLAAIDAVVVKGSGLAVDGAANVGEAFKSAKDVKDGVYASSILKNVKFNKEGKFTLRVNSITVVIGKDDEGKDIKKVIDVNRDIDINVGK